MKRSIRNRYLTVTVKQQGAELCSIQGSSGTEYLWQADQKIWGRHAPILFPIVGRLAEDRYICKGKCYELKQHGLARDMDFEPAGETENSLSYRLLASPDTMKIYPFEFELLVGYTLEGNGLKISYEIMNHGSDDMPFSIGAHPGFALNWGKDDKIEDYSLAFEKPETLDAHLLGRDNLISARTERVLDSDNILPLRNEMFDRDALIFLELNSRKVTLSSNIHSNRVSVEFRDFPYLGIWAKPGAPFVCIEPWHGYADTEDHDGQITGKPGIIMLRPGGTFNCTYRITIQE